METLFDTHDSKLKWIDENWNFSPICGDWCMSMTHDHKYRVSCVHILTFYSNRDWLLSVHSLLVSLLRVLPSFYNVELNYSIFISRFPLRWCVALAIIVIIIETFFSFPFFRFIESNKTLFFRAVHLMFLLVQFSYTTTLYMHTLVG